MKNNKTQQIFKGVFFLPEDPGAKLNGTLSILENNTGWIELFGLFSSHGLFAKRALFTIFGTLMNGEKVSLLESYKQNGIHQKEGSIQNYSVRMVIIGTHIQTQNESFFNNISAEIDHLQEWIGIYGGQLSYGLDFKSMNYNYAEPEPIKFSIDSGLSGNIYFKNEFWEFLPFKNESEQKTRIEFSTNVDVSLTFLLVKLNGFCKLLSFFIGQKVKITKVVLTSNHEAIELISPSLSMGTPLKDIEIYYNDGQHYSALAEHSVCLVKYEDIADGFEEILRKWYKVLDTELSPITDLLLDGLADHRKFDANEFMRTWRGVEAFHRLFLQDTQKLIAEHKERMEKLEQFVTDKTFMGWLKEALHFSYEMPAKKRLRTMIEDNGTILGIDPTDPRIETWVKEMGNTRNYFTHYDHKGKKKKVGAAKLYHYTCLLKALLLILILKRLGVADDILTNITKHQNFRLRFT